MEHREVKMVPKGIVLKCMCPTYNTSVLYASHNHALGLIAHDRHWVLRCNGDNRKIPTKDWHWYHSTYVGISNNITASTTLLR
eukprot:scaffold4199_cov110-Skeletonema_dohrnii-CCMP3373.AAC.3